MAACGEDPCPGRHGTRVRSPPGRVRRPAGPAGGGGRRGASGRLGECRVISMQKDCCGKRRGRRQRCGQRRGSPRRTSGLRAGAELCAPLATDAAVAGTWWRGRVAVARPFQLPEPRWPREPRQKRLSGGHRAASAKWGGGGVLRGQLRRPPTRQAPQAPHKRSFSWVVEAIGDLHPRATAERFCRR